MTMFVVVCVWPGGGVMGVSARVCVCVLACVFDFERQSSGLMCSRSRSQCRSIILFNVCENDLF